MGGQGMTAGYIVPWDDRKEGKCSTLNNVLTIGKYENIPKSI
jgi:hypothetical protein